MKQNVAQLENEVLPKVVIIHGSDKAQHERALSILRQRNAKDPLAEWNWSVFRGDKDFELEPLFAELGMIPWGDSTKIVILQEADLIPAATLENLANWLKDKQKTNPLVLFFAKLDKRLKFLRIMRDFSWEIECNPLEGESLTRYIMDYCLEQGRKLKRDAAELFLARVGTDMLVIQAELAKLLNWSEGRTELGKEDVEAVTSVHPGQIANHTVFQLTDAIIQRKRDEALAVLKLLLAAGEPPLRILPLIDRQFRLVLAAKATKAHLDQTARQMGENSSYGLKLAQPQARRYTLEQIFAAFEGIVKADQAIKLGVPGEEVMVDLIIKLTA